MQIPTCPSTGLTFSIATTAGYYSALAGVLAGFAFAAIILVVPGGLRRSTPRESQPDGHVLASLLIAMLGLIICAIQYAELAGESSCSEILGRAESEELLGGVVFAFAVLALLYAMVLLLERAEVGPVTKVFRFIVAVMAPTLALFLVGLAARDASYAPWKRPGLPGELYMPHGGVMMHWIEAFCVWLPLVLCMACFVMFMLSRGRVVRSTKDPDKVTGGLFLYPYLSLGLMIIAVAESANLSDVYPGSTLTAGEVLACFLVCGAVLALQSGVLLFSSRPASPALPTEHSASGQAYAAECPI